MVSVIMSDPSAGLTVVALLDWQPLIHRCVLKLRINHKTESCHSCEKTGRERQAEMKKPEANSCYSRHNSAATYLPSSFDIFQILHVCNASLYKICVQINSW